MKTTAKKWMTWVLAGACVWVWATGEALAVGGAYSINYKASNPLNYPKYLPEEKSCTAVGGVDTTPIVGAEFIGGVEALTPKDMALGQIVAFQFLLTVNGDVTPENGVISLTGGWSTKTTSNFDFGFDEDYGIYCAFIDAGDSQHIDGGTTAHVSNVSWSLVGSEIQGVFDVSGLDNGDRVALEVWLVLDRVLPNKVTGNVQTRLVSAQTAASDAISTGNQTIPLQKVSDFQLFCAVGDRVWLDTNKNGIQDVGETGLGNVRVELYNTNDVMLAWQNSKIDGTYLFTSLVPGSYYLVFFLPNPTYTFAPQLQGIDTLLDSDPDTLTGVTPVFSLLASETDLSQDAGMFIKPTRVVLTDFAVEAADTGLTVHWATAEEQGAIGFFLERWDAAADAFVRVNETLLPASFDSFDEVAYSLADVGAPTSGTVVYRLLELENTGAINTYGPFSFDLGAPADGRTGEELADAGEAAGKPADGQTAVTTQEPAAVEAPRVTSVTGANGSLVLRWASVEGAVYGIERAASLTGEFLPLVNGLPATAPENVVILVDGAEAGFFRIVRQN